MLLAIETSSRSGSLALARSDGTLVELRSLASPRDHAQGLAPTVQDLIGGDLSSVEAYALSIGPGSFTGLRIGAAFLKGLAVVYPRPTFGVSSLEVIASGAGVTSGSALAVVDARRGQVFAGLYASDGAPDPRLPDGMYAVDEIRERFADAPEVVWVGDGVPLFEGAVSAAPEALWTPRADHLARRAVAAAARSSGADAADVAPVYHQLSAAEVAAGIQAVPG